MSWLYESVFSGVVFGEDFGGGLFVGFLCFLLLVEAVSIPRSIFIVESAVSILLRVGNSSVLLLCWLVRVVARVR